MLDRRFRGEAEVHGSAAPAASIVDDHSVIGGPILL
jgi:hypothetical protein